MNAEKREWQQVNRRDESRPKNAIWNSFNFIYIVIWICALSLTQTFAFAIAFCFCCRIQSQPKRENDENNSWNAIRFLLFADRTGNKNMRKRELKIIKNRLNIKEEEASRSFAISFIFFRFVFLIVICQQQTVVACRHLHEKNSCYRWIFCNKIHFWIFEFCVRASLLALWSVWSYKRAV